MQIFKQPNFKFMKFKFFAFALSGIVIIAGIINMTKGKGLTGGIDFTGGTLVQIRFKNPYPIAELRQVFRETELGSPKIQRLEEEGEKEYIIRTMSPEEETEQSQDAHEIMGRRIVEVLTTEEDRTGLESGLADLNNVDTDELTALLQASFPENSQDIATSIIKLRESTELKGIIENYDQLTDAGISQEAIDFLKEKTFLGSLAVKRRESVGPQVGRELGVRARQATVWALIGMLFYIGLRFKFAYGVAAILTLAHDVLFTLSIFSFTNREINLPVIAAILTIVGYSLNDTIVIFDRVRDNIKGMRKHEFEDILDKSINQTLSRTVVTSGTTFLVVFALFVLGGEVINDFAFTMIIGVIIGTYSSIYQSCPLLYFWNRIFKPKKGMGK
ncbi:MAG: protein translocase subunit SecF [Candidatus Aminicenantes bacterium]|nr:MAG: protein translocase subunit SecF [Candidatus Aminicenantes bacterium]